MTERFVIVALLFVLVAMMAFMAGWRLRAARDAVLEYGGLYARGRGEVMWRLLRVQALGWAGLLALAILVASWSVAGMPR